MISVSGNYWEEEKINTRIIEKVKFDYNLSSINAKQLISKKFNNEEIFLIDNNIKLNNPFLKKLDFIKAVELLDYSIKNQELICIIGDYDVDGTISTSLLVNFLKFLKASYFYYIPNRFKDGYGSSIKLVKKLLLRKPKLVIMVDNGSTSNDAIDYLNQIDVKSIIIDHHETYRPYPKSNIFINPKKISDYSNFDYFCSAGLTYFVIDLYLKKKKLNLDFSKNLHLVLLAIVSDVMPLRKINRIIARKVLNNFNINEEYFFKKIFNLNKIKKKVEIDDFGFLFGPIINSAGRLSDPNIVIDLFTTLNNKYKDKIINKLFFLNNRRKKIEENILNEIDFNKLQYDKNRILIIEKHDINEGLIGIIASKIKSYFNKPCIVITKSGNIYKGSARSSKSLPIGKYVKTAKDLKILESGGGHNLAAGFSLKKEKMSLFKEFIYEKFNKKPIISDYKFLLKLSSTALNKDLVSDLTKLSPYGEDNINPYFLIENVKIVKTKILNNKFISCFIKNKSGKLLNAISFSILKSNISYNILNNKNEVNIVVQIKENFWKNKKSIQVIIIDIINIANKA